MNGPMISIVMPVFDTGAVLLDSVRSIVAQTWFATDGVGWELLIVDDASTDPETRAALDEATTLSPSVSAIPNTRKRGAAGARNTGVFAARGDWIAFLDSDDLWYPDFLQRQFAAFAGHDEASWRAAHFDVGDEHARTVPKPLRERSPCLHAVIADDYASGRVSVLHRPVDVLLRCGCLQVMTVQVRRDLIRSLGGFDETLACAEDYDLWLRLASKHDLHLAPLDAGVYRVRPGSLTKAGRPMYWCEDRMLLNARQDSTFVPFRAAIDSRLRKVYDTFCFHYREHRTFGRAARYALRLIRLAPFGKAGWRHLLATMLRR